MYVIHRIQKELLFIYCPTSLLIFLHVVVGEPLSVLGDQRTVVLLTQQQLQIPVRTLGVFHTLVEGREREEKRRREGREREKWGLNIEKLLIASGKGKRWFRSHSGKSSFSKQSLVFSHGHNSCCFSFRFPASEICSSMWLKIWGNTTPTDTSSFLYTSPALNLLTWLHKHMTPLFPFTKSLRMKLMYI